MFGKKASSADNRVHPRYSPGSMRVVVDGVGCDLLDYSDGGVRIAAKGHVRRVALIEIYKNGKCIRKTPAIVAWRRESETGYAFRSNLKICEVEGAERYATRPAEGDERMTNDSGGVSGSALRARLKM